MIPIKFIENIGNIEVLASGLLSPVVYLKLNFICRCLSLESRTKPHRTKPHTDKTPHRQNPTLTKPHQLFSVKGKPHSSIFFWNDNINDHHHNFIYNKIHIFICIKLKLYFDKKIVIIIKML